MTRGVRLFLVLLSTLALAGCPFVSDVPLGAPRPGSVDPRLLGLWTWIDADGGAVSQLRVRRFNDAEYLVDYDEFGPGVGQPKKESYRAFSALVGGQEILNIQRIDPAGDEEGYVFARFALADCGVLTLRFLGDKAIPEALASDPKGLLAFVEQHAGDSALDDPDGPMHFHRASPGAAPAAGSS